jgi:glutathione S-transferase
MLQLYHYPPSATSIRVRLCLHEKGLSVEERVVDLARLEHLRPAYRALNPDCVVPTLIHDGRVLTESSAIDEYLDEVFPDPPLVPADPWERSRVRAWSRYIDRVAVVAVQSPTFAAFLAPALAAVPRSEIDRAIADIPDVTTQARWRRMMDARIDASEIAASFAVMAGVLDRMEQALAATPFLVGESYTLADLEMTPQIVRLEHLGRSDLLDGRPRLLAWLARIKERPAFDQAYAFLPKSQSGAQTTTADARTHERPGGPEHDQRGEEERDHGRR